jgi:hypothetical protein
MQLHAWLAKHRTKVKHPAVSGRSTETVLTQDEIGELLGLDPYPRKCSKRFAQDHVSLFDPKHSSALDIPREMLREPQFIGWLTRNMPHLAVVWQRKRPESFAA